MKLQFKRVFVFAGLGIASTAALVFWYTPKRVPLTLNKSFTAIYRGFGLHTGTGLFGRNFVGVAFYETVPEDGICYVDLSDAAFNRRVGYYPFRGTYPRGETRSEGTCLVTWNDFGVPEPDWANVQNARYFDPSGTIESGVVDGTGVVTYWTAEGVKTWELELLGYHRKRLKMWDRAGRLILSEDYEVDAKPVISR